MVELCSDIAQMDDYMPRSWPIGAKTLNQWGGPPPLRFLLTGFPVVKPEHGRPSYGMDPRRAPTAAGA
jgi:hypothetical protein